MRVLVTGATGFLGRAVARRLTAEHEVIALVRSGDAGVPSVTSDLLDLDSLVKAVDGVDAVCHLAALTRVRDSLTDPLGYWRVNAVGTINLLTALEQRGGPVSVVLTSTCAVYDLGDGGEPMTESAVERPMTPYAASKLAADHAVADATRTGQVGAVILRALNISGASAGRGDGDHTRLIPQVAAAMRDPDKRLNINGDGSARRDFVHVDDAADAVALAMGACQLGQARIYNLGSGTPSSVREVIAEAGRLAGRELAVEYGPPQPEPLVVTADSTRIRHELGWRPTRSTLSCILTDAAGALG